MNQTDIKKLFKDKGLKREVENFYNNLNELTSLIKTSVIKKSLDIYVNNYCNVACSYCIGKGTQTNQSILNNFIDIIYYLKNNINEYDEVYLTGGGEPLLNFDIIKSVITAIPKDIPININSNGTLLSYSVITDFFLQHTNCKFFLNFQGLNEIWKKQNPKYFHVIDDNFIPNIKKLKDQITIKIIITHDNYKELKFLIEDIFSTFGVTQFQVQPNYIEPDLPYSYTELQKIPNVNITFDSKCDLDMNIITYKHNQLLKGKRCEACIINNNDVIDLHKINNKLVLMTTYVKKTCINCPAFLKICTPCYCHFTTFQRLNDDIRFSNCVFYNELIRSNII